MPKNKKAWVDKKRAETYLVIHRNQKFPQDFSTGQSEQTAGKKDYEEHIKCGVYFNDDYDYMQHLRDRNEVVFLEKAEKLAVFEAPNAGKPILDFPDDTPFLEESDADVDGEFDLEVAAALEGNFDFDDPENVLDDDFIIAANDGVLPSTCPKTFVQDHRSRSESFGEDSEEESDEEDENFDSDEVEMRECSEVDGDEMTCFKQRNDEHRLIDEQFEHLCNEYDNDDELSEIDDEEGEALIDPDSHRMKELVEERKNDKAELVLQNDDFARKFAEEDSNESEDQLEDITIDCPGPKKAKWDCESVLSTYSNIYNRPCLIKEPSRKQRLKPFLKQAEEDYAMEEVKSKAASSIARSKEETKEQKMMRKALVKEQRRERRIEKKCNKLAFKEERLRIQAQRGGVNFKMTPIV